MDMEQLIEEVHEQPAIWQSKHKLHHNRGFIDAEWERIALALNTSKETARSKWKNMKDSYRKELRKVIKKSSGNGGSLQVSKWPYFTMLDFLRDELNPAQMTGNLQKPSGCLQPNDNSEFVNEEEINTELLDLDHILPATDNNETPAQVSRKRKEPAHETVATKMILSEETKVGLLQNQHKQPHEDDAGDYHFLMSLLPYLRSVEHYRKLTVRNKITQVLIDETSVSSGSGFSS